MNPGSLAAESGLVATVPALLVTGFLNPGSESVAHLCGFQALGPRLLPHRSVQGSNWALATFTNLSVTLDFLASSGHFAVSGVRGDMLS